MRLLYICPYLMWLRRVSASRRHDMEAVANHGGVEFHYSGVGWPDWDNKLTGVQNIKRLMPNIDAVIGYKIEGTRIGGVRIPAVRDYRSIGSNYLLVEKLQEAWHGIGGLPGIPFWQQMVDRRVGLCVLSHANDRPRLEEAEKRGIAVEVIHHCAESAVFGAARRSWRGRDIPVVLTGTIGREHYPLRARWRDLQGKVSVAIGTPVHCHARPPHLAKNLAEANQYVQEYADLLGRAKVVLGCSSRYRYALARFPEAAAAGAVHVSDMPDDDVFRDGLGKHIVEVDPEANDAELVGAVRTAMEDDGGLEERSEAAWRLWREAYTQEHFAERFVAAVERCL